MKTNKSDCSRSSREAYDECDAPVRVSGRSYAEFNSWMDRQLAKLVARWAHLAAPNASRRPPLRQRIRKPK